MSLDERIDGLINVCVNKAVRSSPYGMYPSKPGDGGDDCLWLGLLASVDAVNAKQGLLNCQSANEHDRDGMFYRNPERRSNNNAEYGDNYFSRDMGLGALIGLATIPNEDSVYHFNKWVSYIRKEKYCLVQNPITGGCIIHGHSLAPNKDRSFVNPNFWDYLNMFSQCHNNAITTIEMINCRGLADVANPFEAATCPHGYKLHLKALSAYYRYLLDERTDVAKNIGELCYNRSPKNLFFKILAHGFASFHDADEFLRISPDPATFEPQGYWVWEQEDVEGHLDKCCGWDMIFLGLLIKKWMR